MEKEKIIQKSCELISYYLGSVTAEYYEKFYQDKEASEIKASIFELLSEILGPKKAKKEIKALNII